MKTWQAATGKWPGILRHFGVDEKCLVNEHGPCPLCGGKDRFRFDDKDGRGTYYCSHCGPGNGTQLLLKYTEKDYHTLMNEIDRYLGTVPDQEAPVNTGRVKKDPQKINDYIASTLKGLNGNNPVRLYLKNRGLTPTKAIRHCPSLGYLESGKLIFRGDAMVVPFSDPAGQVLTHHCTYLTPCGKKADVLHPKKVLPVIRKLNGGAIRLTRNVYPHMAIAEGIETALAVMQLFNIPCWASSNAVLLQAFTLPESVTRLTIYADNDASYTGQSAATALAQRLSQTCEVNVVTPEQVGQDFADLVAA